MYDNGLIMEHYRTEAARRGILDLKKTPYSQRWGKGVEQYLEFLSTPQGRYYVKEDDKPGCDAEVLLSQIYKRAGLNSAIYTPAKDHYGKNVVLSNDIKTQSNLYAYDFLRKIRNQNPGNSMADGLPMDKRAFPGVNLTRFLTREGIRQLLTMNTLDVASYNDDRHLSNFIFNINALGKANGISVFDYGESGHNFRDARDSGSVLSQEHLTYPNLFNCGHELSRGGIVNQLKNNESTLPYIKPDELAEIVGGIDPVSVARDVKGDIGYKINQRYVDTIASSFDQMAEDLSQ